MSEYIYHPSGESLRKYEAGLRDMYERSLPKHLGKVAIFSLAEQDTELHPPQRMDVVGMRSDVSNVEILRFLGEQAFGKDTFDEFVRTFALNRQLLADIIDLLSAGEHIILGSTHQRTDDIASALGALEIALIEFDKQRRNQLFAESPMRAQLIIGKLITGLNAMGFYTPDLLGALGDTYYSLPSGATFAMSGIPEEIRTDYNSGLLGHMQEDEHTGDLGILRGVALSGTTMVTTPRLFGKKSRPKQIHSSPISKGTVDLMRRHHTIPVAIDIEGAIRRKPSISILPIVGPVSGAESAHHICEDLAQEMSLITGIEHVYHNSHPSFYQAIHLEIGTATIPIARRPREL